MEEFAVNSTRQQFVYDSVQRAATRRISLDEDNKEHYPALLGRFVIMAPSVNVQTYLLTYGGRRTVEGVEQQQQNLDVQAKSEFLEGTTQVSTSAEQTLIRQ